MSETADKIRQSLEAGAECLRNKEYEQAINSFSKGIFLDANNAELYIQRAEAYVPLCDLKSAISNYRKAIFLGREEPEIKRRLAALLDAQAVMYLERDQFDEALSFTQDALSIDSENLFYVLRRAMCHIGMGSHEEALKDLATCESDAECKLHVCLLGSEVYIATKSYVAAKQKLQAGLEVFPEHPQLVRMMRYLGSFADEFRQKATDLMLKRKYELASNALDEGLQVFPNESSLLFKRGLCYRHMGRFESAVNDLLQCLGGLESPEMEADAQRQLALVLNDIAVFLYKERNYEEALVYFSEALKWDSKRTEFLINRGDCYHKMGNLQMAYEEYKKAAELDKEDLTCRVKISALHNEWGTALFNAQKYAAAEAEFTLALDTFSNVADYFINRGKTRVMLKKFTDAIRDFLMALELEMDNQTVRTFILQICPALAGQLDGDIRSIRAAIEEEMRRQSAPVDTVNYVPPGSATCAPPVISPPSPKRTRVGSAPPRSTPRVQLSGNLKKLLTTHSTPVPKTEAEVEVVKLFFERPPLTDKFDVGEVRKIANAIHEENMPVPGQVMSAVSFGPQRRASMSPIMLTAHTAEVVYDKELKSQFSSVQRVAKRKVQVTKQRAASFGRPPPSAPSGGSSARGSTPLSRTGSTLRDFSPVPTTS